MFFSLFSNMPTGVVAVMREALRHLLRRPVVGIAVAARLRADGADEAGWVLIRRGDTGTWAMPGGTLEWGETLRDAMARELEEEAGVTSFKFVRVVGVFSAPHRDLRFHAVTVVVLCDIDAPTKAPRNGVEIAEVRTFQAHEIPHPLAMQMSDMFMAARGERDAVME